MIRIALGVLALAALAAITACGGSSSNTAATGAATTVSASASTAGDGSTTSAPGTATATTATSTQAPGSTTKAPGSSTPKKLGTSAGVATTAKAPDFDALPGAKAVFGKLGSSAYEIEMPTNWNGELVLFAHGFAGFGTEVSVAPPPAALRQQFINEGFAWAASSFSENGYTPGIGADDTLALKQYFAQQYGAPKRTYLVGESMGGNIVSLSLENFADQYDGALSMCGAVAGEEIIDYLTSWTALAEYISGLTFPIGQGVAAMTPVLLNQIPQKLGTADAPTDKGKAFENAIENLTGGPRPFFVEGFKQQYIVNFGLLLLDPDRKTLAASAGTNDGVTYHINAGLGFDDSTLNASIRRLHADPASRNAATHPDAVPTNGNIGKPLLTIHGTGDLYVPISQEQSYRQKADAAGKGDLLVQRAIRSGGHCQFSPQEETQAWDDLVAWVEKGNKPAGDNIMGNLSDAGRQFTNPIRPGDPGGE